MSKNGQTKALKWIDHEGNKLSRAEKLFVDAFTGPAQGSARQAFVLAGGSPGYAGKKADEMLLRPRVQQEIFKRALKAQSVEMGAMTPLEIHNLLRRCAYDADVPWGQRLKAIEMAARCQGMFIDRVAHHHKHEKVKPAVVLDFSKMDNEKLRAFVYQSEGRQLDHEIIDVGEET